MNVSYTIHPGYVRFTFGGEMNTSEVAVILEDLRKDPDFHDSLGFLWDVRDVDPDTVRPAAIPEISALARKIVSEQHPGNVAFLVANAIGFGMSRMASVHAETDRRRANVFYDEAEAIAFASGKND